MRYIHADQMAALDVEIRAVQEVARWLSTRRGETRGQIAELAMRRQRARPALTKTQGPRLPPLKIRSEPQRAERHVPPHRSSGKRSKALVPQGEDWIY